MMSGEFVIVETVSEKIVSNKMMCEEVVIAESVSQRM